MRLVLMGLVVPSGLRKRDSEWLERLGPAYLSILSTHFNLLRRVPCLPHTWPLLSGPIPLMSPPSCYLMARTGSFSNTYRTIRDMTRGGKQGRGGGIETGDRMGQKWNKQAPHGATSLASFTNCSLAEQ